MRLSRLEIVVALVITIAVASFFLSARRNAEVVQILNQSEVACHNLKRGRHRLWIGYQLHTIRYLADCETMAKKLRSGDVEIVVDPDTNIIYEIRHDGLRVFHDGPWFLIFYWSLFLFVLSLTITRPMQRSRA